MRVFLPIILIITTATVFSTLCRAMEVKKECNYLHYLPQDRIEAEEIHRNIAKNQYYKSFEENFAKKNGIPSQHRSSERYQKNMREFISVINGHAIMTINYYNQKSRDRTRDEKYHQQREKNAALIQEIIKIIVKIAKSDA